MGIPSVQYNRYYGTNLFVKSNTHANPDNKYMAVALSVAHTALHYCSENYDDRTTNGRNGK